MGRPRYKGGAKWERRAPAGGGGQGRADGDANWRTGGGRGEDEAPGHSCQGGDYGSREEGGDHEPRGAGDAKDGRDGRPEHSGGKGGEGGGRRRGGKGGDRGGDRGSDRGGDWGGDWSSSRGGNWERGGGGGGDRGSDRGGYRGGGGDRGGSGDHGGDRGGDWSGDWGGGGGGGYSRSGGDWGNADWASGDRGSGDRGCADWGSSNRANGDRGSGDRGTAERGRGDQGGDWGGSSDRGGGYPRDSDRTPPAREPSRGEASGQESRREDSREPEDTEDSYDASPQNEGRQDDEDRDYDEPPDRDRREEPLAEQPPAPSLPPQTTPQQTTVVYYGNQDVRFEATANIGAQDVRFQNQDVRFQNQDVRRGGGGGGQQEPKSGSGRSRKGAKDKERRGGGGGGGGGGGKGGGGAGGGKESAETNGEKKSGRSGRNRGGGGGGGGGGGTGGGGEGGGGSGNPTISSKIRKIITSYEETLDVTELVKAYEAFEASIANGEGCCDAPMLTALLISLTRISQLHKAHKVIDAAVEHKVYLDVPTIIAISIAVSQRSQSHRALRYLRRLIYETLPPDFGAEQIQFLDRHASFIFSELMAEADGCFGRMENRDPNTLVNLGHTELEVYMDWAKSSSNSFTLYNRSDEKGKKVYQPTVFGGGFQRTDSALMSFDISIPEVAAQINWREYDRIRDGAEVEVTGSAIGPNAGSGAGPSSSAPLSVKLTSPPKMPFRPGMAYRLDRLASRDQTRRMLDALKIVLKKPSLDGDGQSSLQPAEQLRELILIPVDTTLTKAGKADLPLEPMDYGGDRQKLAGVNTFKEEIVAQVRSSLNESQLQALTLACTQRVTLIQGPPGTGKTTTAVQIVSALVRYELVDLPMLVTADSNTAVDNLVKGIGKKGLKVVRVGRPESIREDVKQYALDGRWKELKKAEVVCATCIGASGTTLDKVRFSTVLIDECTQAAESAALVPIARGCQQCILIGDQCQLPPTVLSDVAENENLGESMFTRLVTQGVRPVLLDTQYRMHPLIAEFASAAFYNGRLQNGVSHIHRRPPEGFPWPQRQMPVAFVNLERGEEKREGSSYINPAEAEKTLWALQEVCRSDQLGPEDVGLVTPYKGQVNFIKKLIRERPGLQKFRSGLEVESVDGFQGQEKEVIIFCAVRNNRDGKVGFLSDWRRLNVMLTRARRGCIVIGSRSTLVSDPLWQQWLLWATARGAICGESAKGTWVPRYLVDDRDGVWTVKACLMAEADKPGIADQPVIAAGAPKVEATPLKEPEILESWEDMDSPMASPAGDPAHAPGGLLDETMEEEPIPALAFKARKPPGKEAEDLVDDDVAPRQKKPAEMSRATEARAARFDLDGSGETAEVRPIMCEREDSDHEEAEAEAVPEAEGGDALARTASKDSTAVDEPPVGPRTSHVRSPPARQLDTADDEMRRSGTPNLGPKSPNRQLALAKLGLVDDLDLEEEPAR